MKSLFWFVFGVMGGFVLAHLVDRDPRGHEVLAEIDSRISEFTDRMSDAYRDQEAKFTGAIDGAKDAAGAVSEDASNAPSPETSAPSAESSAPSAETSAPSAETSAPSPETSAPSAEGGGSGDAVPTPKDVAEHTSVADVQAVAGAASNADSGAASNADSGAASDADSGAASDADSGAASDADSVTASDAESGAASGTASGESAERAS